MAYAIADVELTEPLGELRLAPGEDGIFVLLRAHGRPVHYSMHALEPGARLDERGWRAVLGGEAVEAILEHALYAELRPAVSARPVDLTVAVCTRARPELLAACLRSVVALGAGDVVVVDNDPPDDATARLVGAFPGVRYVREPRTGLDFARNRALAESGGTWIAFLDDDVVVDRGWLAGLQEAVAEHPDAASVTGLVLPSELITAAQIAFERRGGFGRGCRKVRFAAESEPGNPLYPLGSGIFGAGCNMVLRADAVRAIGGFDEALDTGRALPGGGDLDVWSRLARAGHPLAYEPSMLVFHRHRRDRAALRRQYWSWGEGFLAYLTKTARRDPAQRMKAARLLAWWFGYAGSNVAAGLRAGDGSADLALAELLGGVEGLAGSYGRSRRRTARIRAMHG